MSARTPEEILMYMVYNRDYDAVYSLLKRRVNVNFQNNDGFTPLLGATEQGDYRIVKLLLDHGADSNGRGRLTHWHYSVSKFRPGQVLEWTPLINAALYGHPRIVQLLIDHGADMNFRDINGRSALNAALQRSIETCAEVLILNGAEVTPFDFTTASINCPSIDLNKLLEERNKLKAGEKRPKLKPLLHPYAIIGDCNKLQDLIKKGIDINMQDDSGNTALHVAIENRALSCAALLIRKGVDVSIPGKNNSTALHSAATVGMTKIIRLLVEKGAVVDARDNDEITPLHYAVFNSHPMCVKQLLNFGACVNSVFADGKTALHVAVSKSASCIELLMKENANVFKKDKTGICPLELSMELGLDTFKKLFHGKYNVTSMSGTTPLHIAAYCYKVDCLKLMIQDGCDVNVTNNNGDTPLHFACRGRGIVSSVLHGEANNLKDTHNVEILIKAGANVNKKNSLRISPVHVCAERGLHTQLLALSKFGAKLNSRGGAKKQTPLHFAAEAGNLPCVKFLIEKGTEKKAVNSDKLTALMLAARNAHFSCVKFLLQNDVPLWMS